MRSKAVRTAAIVVVLIALLIGGGAALITVAWGKIHEPYQGYEKGEQYVDIPQGASPAEIRRRLIEAGVVPDDLTVRAALWWSGRSRSLKAGEYRFDRPITPLAVVEKIANGEVYTKRITFPEGLTIREMAALYESHGFGSARDFVAAAGDASAIRDLDPQAKDLEGYLFPETYPLPRVAPAGQLIQQMVDRFRATYQDVVQGRSDSLTTRQIVTLASLIEKETAQSTERSVVSAVYRNRIKKGMGMQADPTVVYALVKAGRYDGNIRRADLDFDSPYNTYKYPGLPPGPIASPGRASLEAALSPSNVPFLYFVSRNDGTHVFAETLTEHNANVYRYQVQYFRRGQGGRGQGGRGKWDEKTGGRR
jgi:peptidoglycan lytic transglycosylase G